VFFVTPFATDKTASLSDGIVDFSELILELLFGGRVFEFDRSGFFIGVGMDRFDTLKSTDIHLDGADTVVATDIGNLIGYGGHVSLLFG
jgi:hypothetical protein